MAAVQTATASQAILDALNGSREKAAASNVTQDRFLTLLVSQLKNQDPLNPMDNAQMTSQLAQISTVDGITRLNETLSALMSNASETQALQAAALVGHGVLVPGSGMSLQGGNAIGGFDLSAPADRVVASIRDANGLLVRTLDLGAREAGNFVYSWDGAADNGAQAADGRYNVELKAYRGSTTFAPSGLELGVVTSVTRGSSGVSLDLGSLGTYRFDEVKRII